MEYWFWPKVENQAYGQPRAAKVIEELSSGCWWQPGCGLDFDDEATVDDHVDPVAAYPMTFVKELQGNFTFDEVATTAQFDLERRSIIVLEKAESKSVVDFEEGTQDGFGEFLVNQSVLSHSVECSVNYQPPSSRHFK